MKITISDTTDINDEQLLELCRANHWSVAEKPIELRNGLLNSYILVTAWGGKVIN